MTGKCKGFTARSDMKRLFPGRNYAPQTTVFLGVLLLAQAVAGAVTQVDLSQEEQCATAVLESLSYGFPQQQINGSQGLSCFNATSSPQAVTTVLSSDPRCLAELRSPPPPGPPPPAPGPPTSSRIEIDLLQCPGWANGLLTDWFRSATMDRDAAITSSLLRYNFNIFTMPSPRAINGSASTVRQYTSQVEGGAGSGGYAALTADTSSSAPYVVQDITEDFEHLPETSCVLSSSPTGPLHPRAHLLMWYRTDALTALAAAGATASAEPPDDWDGLAALLAAHAAAVAANGTAGGDGANSTAGAEAEALPRYGLCLTTNPHCGRLADVLAAIAASIVQTGGASQGYVYDISVAPPSAPPLVNGSGWRHAVEVMQRLLSYNAPADATPEMAEAAALGVPYDCYAVSPLFTAGNCMLTLEWDAALSYMVAPPVLQRPGVLAAAPLPGSLRVVAPAAGSTTGSSGSNNSSGSSSSNNSSSGGEGLVSCTADLCSYSVNHDLLYGMYGNRYDNYFLSTVNSTSNSSSGGILDVGSVEVTWPDGYDPSTNFLAAVASVESAAVARLEALRSASSPSATVAGTTAMPYSPSSPPPPTGGSALSAQRPLVNRAPYSAFFESTMDINYGGITQAAGDVAVLAAAFEAGRLRQLAARLVRQVATDQLRVGLGAGRGRRNKGSTAADCDSYIRAPWWLLAPHLPGDTNTSSSSRSSSSSGSSSGALQVQLAAAAAVAEAVLTARGVPSALARTYLRAVWYTTHAPNTAPDVPSPTNPNWFRWAIAHAALELLPASAAPPPSPAAGGGRRALGSAAAADGVAAVDSATSLMSGYFVLAAEVLGPAAVRSFYEASISAPAWQDPNKQDEDPSSRYRRIFTAYMVGCIVGGVLLLLAAGVVVWALCLRRRTARAPTRHRDLLGRVRAPRVGPDTTLLITDVQNSTVLWEALSVATMDAALQLHHAAIRRMLALHDGYESATEGDSFIVAFACPASAAAFATACQLELLHQDWPEELLAHPDGAVVLVDPREAAAAAQQLQLHMPLAAAMSDPLYGSGAGSGGGGFAAAAAAAVGGGTPTGDGGSASAPNRFIIPFLRVSTAGRRLLYGGSGKRRSSGLESPSRPPLGSSLELMHAPHFGQQSASASSAATLSNAQQFPAMQLNPSFDIAGGGTGVPLHLMRMQPPPPGASSVGATATATVTVATTSMQPQHGLDGSTSPSTASRLGPGGRSGAAAAGGLAGGGGGAGPLLPASGNSGSLSALSYGAVRESAGANDSRLYGSVGSVPGLRGAAAAAQMAWRESLAAEYPVAPPPASPSEVALTPPARGKPTARLPDGRIVAFRGLRVRMGLHSGLENPRHVLFNKVAASYQYGGDFAEAARLVSETAPGGAVVMSAATFARLRNSVELGRAGWRAARDVLVAYAGHHVLKEGDGGGPTAAAAAAAPLSVAISPPSVASYAGSMVPGFGGGGGGGGGGEGVDSEQVEFDLGQPEDVLEEEEEEGAERETTGPDGCAGGSGGGGGCADGGEGADGGAAPAPPADQPPRQAPPPLRLAKSRGKTLLRHRSASHPFLPHSYSSRAPTPHPTSRSHLPSHLPSHLHPPASSAHHHLPAHASSSPHQWLLPQPLYIAVPAPLLCRLALSPPLRSRWVAQVSSLDAPTGRVAVAFLKVVGAATLLADLPGPAAAALEQCQRLVCGLLGGAGGYLVEGCGDGLVLAAFGSPAAAAEWALDCVDGLKRLDWDPALLAHELCEEVVTVGAQRGVVHSVTAGSAASGNGATGVVAAAAATAAAAVAGAGAAAAGAGAAAAAAVVGRFRPGSAGSAAVAGAAVAGAAGGPGVASAAAAGGSSAAGGSVSGGGAAAAAVGSPPAGFMRLGSVALRRQATTLSRGLRIKVGIDVGFAACSLTPASGRLSYRGKVMNRAARIAGIAAAGQVLCSGAAWEEVTAEALRPPPGGGLPPCLCIAAVSLGPMTLKGIKEAMEVLQVVRDDEGYEKQQLAQQQVMQLGAQQGLVQLG